MMWLAVRLESPLVAPVVLARPELRGTPLAVCSARVRDVSPEARAAGVRPGMSLRLALRRCPALRFVEPPAVSAQAEVRALLEAEVGSVQQERRGLLVPITAGSVGEIFTVAERIALRIWQAAGVKVRLAIATDGQLAMRFARLLASGSVAYVPASADAVWRRSRPRPGSPAMPDVEGIVAAARAVAARATGAGRVLVQGAGARLELACANEASAAATVESVLRGQALRLGEVSSVRWEAHRVSVPAQVPLRLAR